MFKGLQAFANRHPVVVTGDTYQDGKGLRRQGELFAADCIVNIFNISKINSEFSWRRQAPYDAAQGSTG